MARYVIPVVVLLAVVGGYVVGQQPGADGIDERFSGVPVLQKPVDREQLLRVLATRTQGTAGNSVSMPRAVAG